MKKIIFFILIFLLTFSISFAHQPRIVGEETTNIKNPEVSQAFYGELEGASHVYTIDSEVPFRLYIGILVPDLPNIDKDVSVKVTRADGEYEYLINGIDFGWTSFYEEFAGDNYFEGPELKAGEVGKGIYKLEVFSPDNIGKYILVVGEKEEFPASEIINTIKTLPTLKAEFFEKSPFGAYFNLIGLFIFGPVLLLIVAILIVVYVKKAKKNRRK